MPKPPSKPINPDYAIPHILADSDAVQVSFNPDHRLVQIVLCSDRPLFGDAGPRPVVVARIALTVPTHNALAKTLSDLAAKISSDESREGETKH